MRIDFGVSLGSKGKINIISRRVDRLHIGRDLNLEEKSGEMTRRVPEVAK